MTPARVGRKIALNEAVRAASLREKALDEQWELAQMCYEAGGLALRRVRPGPQCDEFGAATLSLTESIAVKGDSHERRLLPFGVTDIGGGRRSVGTIHIPIPSPGGA